MTTNHTAIIALFNAFKQPKNKALLKSLLLLLLTIYILFALANMFWQFVPAPASPKIPMQISQQQAQPNVTANNVQDLIAVNIFGKAKAAAAQPVSAVTNAPETKLNLTLTGVVASTTEDDGAAVIANRNNQSTYGIGEKIEGTQATLSRVFADRVIISNRGAKETLMLDGIDFSKISTQADPTNSNAAFLPANQTIPKNIVKTLAQGPSLESIAQLRDQPEKFIDFINVAPFRSDGELQGYRVSPGKDAALFNDTGLQSGDVITYINGLDLTQPREAVEAMQALRQSDSLVIAVLRNDQPMTLSLSLP
jgi:general secretion pathway protein C